MEILLVLIGQEEVGVLVVALHVVVLVEAGLASKTAGEASAGSGSRVSGAWVTAGSLW